MQPRPSFTRALLILISISIVLMFGSGCALAPGDPNQSRTTLTAIPPGVSPSASGTQPPSALASTIQNEPPPGANETGPNANSGPPVETPPSPSASTPENPSAPPAAQTPAQTDSGPPVETLPSPGASTTGNLSTPSAAHTSAYASTQAYPEATAETLPPPGATTTKSLPTPSAAQTSAQFQPLSVGKHDDTDPNIVYDRFWTLLKNPGTKNAYKGTIHASTGTGNEASFRFTGERFHLGYQRGKNFGTVIVIIDDQPYNFHEQAFDLFWTSPQLSPGDHFVRIIHESGETITLDYVVILD